ncbi:DUF883 family protein [Fulvimarina endophytica]|uniref:DUF883 family protein n=1 Tax=Fulvimarina endophytica TaxID=2293836 RepID=A0A371XAL2_9HYPH|nr:DUF883 family protein [Fulvimarina endophytica]RFC66277.1 DUF883 family protein [Fulvimarina endophytica]
MASDNPSSSNFGTGSSAGSTSSSTTGGTTSPGSSFSGSSATGSTAKRGDREELEAQIAKLREDVSGVAESLRAMATNRSNDARGQASAMANEYKAKGERYLQQAQEAADDLEEQLSDRVREEPIKSVLIAAAIGYLYARIFH